MADALVIGIGNVARGDDGVAHRVIDILKASGTPSAVRLVTSPDLDVAMAIHAELGPQAARRVRDGRCGRNGGNRTGGAGAQTSGI